MKLPLRRVLQASSRQRNRIKVVGDVLWAKGDRHRRGAQDQYELTVVYDRLPQAEATGVRSSRSGHQYQRGTQLRVPLERNRPVPSDDAKDARERPGNQS